MLKFQYFGHLMRRADSLEKTVMLGKIEGRKRRGRQDKIVGWHHQLNGHEFEQAPGYGDGLGSLACYSPWGRKEVDMTERLNNNNIYLGFPGSASGKEPACQCRRHKTRRFDSWVRKIRWSMKQQPTPVFLPGESHGRRRLAGYSLQCHRVEHD